MNNRFKQNNSAFTLVELAVTLTIIVLIFSAGLSFVASKAEEKRLALTNERLDFIEEAIADYVDSTGNLPCPASLTRPSTDNLFGEPEGSVGACSATDSGVFEPTGNVFVGTIPFKELGISPRYLTDGWNNRFYYAIDEDVANNVLFGTSDIQIFQEGSPDIELSSSGEIAYFILSTGQNQFNSYSLKGTTRTSPAGGSSGTNETENTDNDAVFRDELFQTQGDYFDDLVRYQYQSAF